MRNKENKISFVANNKQQGDMIFEYDIDTDYIQGRPVCETKRWWWFSLSQQQKIKQYPEFKNALRTHKLKRYNEK